ncbi:acetate--CoA ligase family protein [Cryptosporangium sp. NPDC048952]|uniref:acetate--CoA ligase family protein n=1 Tax=Cryptosporangium sp. NPDC048952 TaxID=3363961 RepID=UPI00371223ED
MDLIKSLVEPTGVVLVGASSDPRKSSGRSLAYLQRYGYRGRIQVVNPRHDSVAGVPCVPAISALEPGSAQAAIVNLPAERVTEALTGLAAAGVETAVVIGSGFEDHAGGPRRQLEAFLTTPGRRMRVIGPNCVGTMSIASGTHLNFSSVLQTTTPKRGGAALVTQSGASGNGLLMSLLRRGTGLAHWFSTGDELDVGAMELVAGLLERDEVDRIGLFLEGITDVDWLPRVRELVEATGKHVFLVKVADSDLGKVAAGGHTGRVVGSKDISGAVLAQSGFRRLPGLAELADCLVVEQVVGQLPAGAKIAGASVSGAGGVVLADQVRAAGTLALPSFGTATATAVSAISGGRVAATNPLDVPFLGETVVFTDLLVELSERGGCDVVVGVASSLAHDREAMVTALSARPADAAPIVLTHLSEDDPLDPDLIAKLADANVAVVPTPERSIGALARTVSGTPEAAAPAGGGHGPMLGLEAVAAVLPADFPWSRWRLVSDEHEAAEAAEVYGFPVAIKAAGRTITHRSDLGAVELVRDTAALHAAYTRVAAVCAEHGDAVVVQQGVPSGQDLLLAVLRDPEYGLTVVLRPGGVLAELLDEQVVLWHAWDAANRSETLRASRVGTLLSGYRGGARGDVEALEHLVETVLTAFAAHDLPFAEFNPVVVAPGGVYVLDALAAQA